MATSWVHQAQKQWNLDTFIDEKEQAGASNVPADPPAPALCEDVTAHDMTTLLSPRFIGTLSSQILSLKR